MATLTIRGLDDEVKARLRVASASHGHSMEEEVRLILKRALVGQAPEHGLGERIHARFAKIGGGDLALPERGSKPRPARLLK